MERNPNRGWGHAQLALVLKLMGYAEEALTVMQMVLSLSPDMPVRVRASYASILYALGRF